VETWSWQEGTKRFRPMLHMWCSHRPHPLVSLCPGRKLLVLQRPLAGSRLLHGLISITLAARHLLASQFKGSVTPRFCQAGLVPAGHTKALYQRQILFSRRGWGWKACSHPNMICWLHTHWKCGKLARQCTSLTSKVLKNTSEAFFSARPQALEAAAAVP
jgi:hypothetical protein